MLSESTLVRPSSASSAFSFQIHFQISSPLMFWYFFIIMYQFSMLCLLGNHSPHHTLHMEKYSYSEIFLPVPRKQTKLSKWLRENGKIQQASILTLSHSLSLLLYQCLNNSLIKQNTRYLQILGSLTVNPIKQTNKELFQGRDEKQIVSKCAREPNWCDK